MLFSANVFAQVVGLLIYPLITRLFTSEDFGLLSFFLSMGGFLSLLATSEYQNAVLFPKEERKAVALVHWMLPLILMVCLVSALVIPFSHEIEVWGKAPGFASISWLLPFFILCQSVWVVLNYWLMRHKQFKGIASYQVTQNLMAAGTKVGFGFLHYGPGLIISAVVSPLVGALLTVGAVWKRCMSGLFVRTSRAERLAVAREYRQFPCFNLPSTIINNVSNNLPVWVLTPIFSTSLMGYYGLALTLSFQPVRLITSSMYQVLYQDITERVKERRPVLSMVRKQIVGTLALVVPTFALLGLFLPELTAWLLGEGYGVTGEYIQLMLPWIGMTLVGGVLAFVPNVFRKQHIATIVEATYCVLRLLALLVGVWMQDIKIAILAYSLTATCVITGQVVWYVFMLKKYEKSLA